MLYIGSDHAGYELKEEIQKYLAVKGEKAVDLGVFAAEPPSDYPDIAHELAEKIHENHGARGILVCGTGIGMCMTANKTPGVRAAVCETPGTAEMARKHNDANVLCIGGRVVKLDMAQKMVDIFLNTPFENAERHARRVNKIDKL